MILALIAACEVGFWVFLAAGLAARYVLHRRSLSVTLLVMAPFVDLILLGAAAWSLQRGDAIEIGHALAAVYLGFSVAYGHRLIGWLDRRFSQRFEGAATPERVDGAAYTRQCWEDVGRTMLAAAVASALTALLITIADDGANTQVLHDNFRWMGLVLGLDVLWAISYTVLPRKVT